MKTLKQQVFNCLKLYPETRNSDITLTLKVWSEYYVQMLHPDPRGSDNLMVYAKDLFNLPREDHVKRIRAKIQNQDRVYLPTDPNILLERAKLSAEWKEFLGYSEGWIDKDWTDAIADYFKQTPDILFKNIQPKVRGKNIYCPVCSGNLKTKIDETETLEGGSYKVKKTLICVNCDYEKEL